MFLVKNKAFFIAISMLATSLHLQAQTSSAPNWRINAGMGYGTYFGDVSPYQIKKGSDWGNLKHFLEYNKNYVHSPSYHVSIEKKLSNRSGILFSSNYTDVSMSDRYITNDGKLKTGNANFLRALNFRSKIYDLGVGYKLKSNEKAFLAPYLWLGGGISFFNTMGDLYDNAGGAYNYASPTVLPDNTYETNLRNELTETDAKYRDRAPYANVGVGLAVKLSKAFAVGIESDVKYSFSDYIDDVSSTYKTFYTSPQQAYAAKPGTNTVDPVRLLRGNNDGVNDFYIQNRVVLKFNFFAASKKRRSARGSFSAPIIFPDYYPVAVGDSASSLYKPNNRPQQDSVQKDASLISKSAQQSATLDSLMNTQTKILTRLTTTVDSLGTRVDTLDKKLRRAEQKERAAVTNKALDSLQRLLVAVERKQRKSATDSLRMRVYGLQADSIVNNATRNGVDGNSLHNVRSHNAYIGEAVDTRTSTSVVLGKDTSSTPGQKQNDSQSQLQKTRADALQHRLDSLLRLQKDTLSNNLGNGINPGSVSNNAETATRTITVKDTIAQQKLEALNENLQQLYNNNDSLKNTLQFLYLQQEATQIQITNDSLRLQALRQQQTLAAPTQQDERKWYEVLKKNDTKAKEQMQQRDEAALQITMLERQLNDLRNRNARLEEQVHASPQVTARYFETTNTNERRRYANVESELQELNRQLGRERRYVPVVTEVAPPQTDNTEMQREIGALREELHQMKTLVVPVEPPQPDTATVQADENTAKLTAVTQMLDSLNREMAALKQQANSPVPVKTPVRTISIYFNNGSVVASSAQRTKLSSLPTVIKATSEIKVQLKAYTDATGNVRVNEALSQKRATYVKNYLVQQFDIPAQNITVELNPSSKSAGGVPNPLDRRVDILITLQD